MNEAVLPLELLGVLLFSLLGPISVMPKFAMLAVGIDPAARRKVALFATLYATLALVLAVGAGATSLAKLGVSKPALILAAGLLLLVISLRNVLAVAGAAPANAAKPSPASLALSPLAVPGIVHPVGVCVLVLFAAYFPGTSDQLAIFGLICGLMLLNFIAMLVAPAFMRLVGMAPLIILGAVFGVLQVALGIQFLISGFTRLMQGG